MNMSMTEYVYTHLPVCWVVCQLFPGSRQELQGIFWTISIYFITVFFQFRTNYRSMFLAKTLIRRLPRNSCASSMGFSKRTALLSFAMLRCAILCYTLLCFAVLCFNTKVLASGPWYLVPGPWSLVLAVLCFNTMVLVPDPWI